MAYQACLTEIRNASGISDMTDDEAESFLDAVLAAKGRIMGARAIGADEALREAAQQAAADHAAAAALEKRNALLNLQARVARRGRIQATPDLVSGIQSEIHGINTPLRGGRFSAEAEWKALNRTYQVGLVGELDKAGLFKAARDGSIERQWARELFEISKGEDGKPGVTGSKEALAIAKIVSRYQALAKENLNRAGASVGDYSGYVTRTAHDADKICRAGYEGWRDAILPALDPRTFEGVDDRNKFLRGVWHGLVTGVHLTEDGMTGWKDPAFTGPGNMAKRLSEGRVLHFKDADSWLDYHSRFGGGNVIELVVQNLDRAARSTALMRRWGTNPRAEFQGDMRYFGEAMRDSNPDGVVKLRQAETDLQHRFDFLDGTANQPVNSLGARVGSTARVVELTAKLGSVAFTHLSSLVTKAAELRYHGVGLLEGYGDSMHSLVRGRGAGETREVMDLLLAGMEGMQRDMLGRFQPDDGVPGTLSKLAGTFFKWTGLTYLLNAQKAGAEFTMARHLGSLLDRPHGDLPAEAARMLKLYRIDPAHWDMLRAVGDHASVDGRKFLTPDAATRVDPASAEAHLRAVGTIGEKASAERIAGQVDAFRQDLGLRLHALYNDLAERAVITPGIPEKALMLQASRPGSILGEVLRFVAQFKQWPAAAIRQGLGREVYGGQSLGGAVGGLTHIAIGSLLTGYIAMSAKDAFKGQTPRDPSAPATWAAALMQGGGAESWGITCSGNIRGSVRIFPRRCWGRCWGAASMRSSISTIG